jgi:nucleoside-diphosphate-sugar epimerase
MKIVVTGAGGFVATYLVPMLADRGHKIIALQKTASGRKDITTISTGYLTPDDSLGYLLEGVDCMVHLAGYAHDLVTSDSDALDRYRKTNVELTQRLAQEAAKHGVRRFVFISSVKAIGESSPVDKPFDETTDLDPTGSYACSKADAEKRLAMVAKETGLEVVILRPPLVYGYGAKANMEKMVRMVAQHRLIPVPANGGKRSFIYVGNLADAIRLVVEDERAGGKTYLVSDGNDKTMEEMIHSLAKGAGRSVITVPIPDILMKLAAVAGDCFRYLTGRSPGFDSTVYKKINAPLQVNAEKIRNQLEWSPPYSLELACVESMASFRSADTEKTAENSATAEVLPAPLLPGAPAATIIIVNYNGGDLLTKCVSSVLASSVQVQVIVSDNASADGSLAVSTLWSGQSDWTTDCSLCATKKISVSPEATTWQFLLPLVATSCF